MPIGQWASGSFFAVHAFATLGQASGTITGTVATPTGSAATGSVTQDRSTLLGFLGGGSTATDAGLVRHCSARVSIAGSDVATITDTVKVEEAIDDPVKTAEFTIADPLVAVDAWGSYSYGDLDCTADMLAGRPGDVKTWRAFVGVTEAAPNSGAYRPRASFRAVGTATRWATTPGCVRLGAFSGKTRGQLLEILCASAGVTIANAGVALLGAVVQRPVEYIGDVGNFVRRVGEVEGWHIAPNDDGTLELIFEANLLSGPVAWAFDESNVFSVDQEPPSRPTTKWTLSCSVMTDDTLANPGQVTTITQDGGYNSAGLPYTIVTELVQDQGVTILKKVTEYQTVQTPGVTLGAAVLQIVSQTETRSNYAQAIPAGSTTARFTTQLQSRVTKTWQLTGIPASADYGTVYTWDGGGVYTTASASLIQVGETRETFTWSSLAAGAASDCSLQTVEIATKAYYSPLADPATGHLYEDGSYRLDTSYLFQTREEEIINWSDYRYPALVGSVATEPRVLCVSRRRRFVPIGYAEPPNDTKQVETTTVIDAEVEYREWLGNATNTHWTYTRRLVLPNPGITQGALAGGGTQLAFERAEGDGGVPGPSFGSSETPQIKQQIVISTYDVSASVPYTPEAKNELFEIAESFDELQAVALRRFRRALATTLRVRHRDLPALRVGHRVSVTNAARGLVAQEGYISAITRTRNLLTGEGRQFTTVIVPPGF